MTLSIACCARVAWSEDGASASQLPSLRTVPPGLTLTRPDALRLDWREIGGEVKAFTAPEWAEVGHLVVDYRWLWTYAGQLEQVVALRTREAALLRAHITVLEGMLAAADGGRRQLGDALTASVEIAERERKAARFERGLLIGGVVLEAVIIVVESGVLVARSVRP